MVCGGDVFCLDGECDKAQSGKSSILVKQYHSWLRLPPQVGCCRPEWCGCQGFHG